MKKLLLLLVAATAISVPATAQIGIAVRAGTLGPGVEIAYAFSPKLSLRATGSYLTYSDTQTLDDEEIAVELEGDATVGAFGANLDFHPFGNFFRLTAGLQANLFEVNASGIPTEEYCFGNEDAGGVCDGKVFTPQRTGSFGASVGYSSKIAPYLGLGFGKVAGRSRVGFLFDIGTLYTGSPVIDLEADGLLAPTASTEQEDELNAGIESFKWYPVVSIGLALRF